MILLLQNSEANSLSGSVKYAGGWKIFRLLTEIFIYLGNDMSYVPMVNMDQD